MTTLVFGRDGVLRLSHGVRNRAEDKLYPLQLPVSVLEDRRPGIFLSFLDAGIAFDKGITVGEVLTCLKPWTETVAAIASCDFAAFLAEVANPETSEHVNDSDIVALVYTQEIAAEPTFERNHEDGDFARIPGSRMYQLRKRAAIITDRHDVTGRWDCLCYPAGAAESFRPEDGSSLSMLPLAAWQHLAFHIVDYNWLIDRTVTSPYLTHKEGLFSADHPLVEEVCYPDSDEIAYRRLRVTTPWPTLKDTLLDGLIGEIGFFGSPEERSAARAEVEASAEKCDADHALQHSFEDSDGRVDEARLTEIEAVIEAELATERARKEVDRQARPYNEEDLTLIALAREIEASDADLLRAPEGIPDPGD